jgi:prepilin-type N-terminal cleavage/methylation domain-containing protein
MELTPTIRRGNRSRISALASARFRAGFTLIEMMISIFVGLIVIGSIVTLSIISAQNFAGTANYVDMDEHSGNAMDVASREIRNATALIAFSTNYPQFLKLTNAYKATTTTIVYTNSSVILKKTGLRDYTLLTGCTNFSFQLFNRDTTIINTITNTIISFNAATNPTTGIMDPNYCKVINLNWQCSRHIIGSQLSTEVAQSAQVVLRNQFSK